MTTDYKNLLLQKAELEARIAAALAQEKSGAIAQAQAIVEQFGLTQGDVFASAGRKPAAARSIGQPRFRNPQTGVTWTGRGKPPNWILGQDRDSFAI